MIVIKKFLESGFISAFNFFQEILLCVCHHGVVVNLLSPGKDENDIKNDNTLLKKVKFLFLMIPFFTWPCDFSFLKMNHQ
tara:strand:- start:10823 stop:11062 length:240 start_codon:yes stop_codon:yes gene_type:complete